MPLLTTKLYVPPPRPNLVERRRLIERLDEGLRLGRKLTLVSAPAGFGKTTLLSEWIAHRGRPTAWLSLDEGDNDPVRFLAYLVAALQGIEGDIGEDALAALRSPRPPPAEELLTVLINQIAGVSQGDLEGDHKGRPYVLVLDDYHLVTAQPVHDALAFLLDHLPENMHLAIATRADPPLPIARLRARGLLTELRLSDLRFTAGEATAFLNQVMGLDLAPDDAAALEARTEGWISGLQMAALSLQDREDASDFIRAFTGSNRHVLDYLIEEVLDRQSPAIQEFLLQTSILDRLSGPLCDSLTRSLADSLTRSFADSQAVLEHLERTNLFILPLDNERRWYRYHRLFADLLRGRLQQTQPGLVPVLHHRASQWYERNELMAEAIDHALAAQDFERAAHLIEQAAEVTLMRSEVATLLGWVEALPEEAVNTRSPLRLYHAWALTMSGGPLETIESCLQDLDRDAAWSGQVAAMRALVAFSAGDIPRAAELSRQALEGLPEENVFLHSLATWILSAVYLADGDLVAGSQLLDEVLETSQEIGNVMVAAAALNHRGRLYMRQGRLHEAQAIFEQALELAKDEQGHPLPVAGRVMISLGDLRREWNDLEAAARYLVRGIELIGRWREAAALPGYIALARVRQAQGDADGARAATQQARQLAIAFDATDWDDLLVEIYQARLWLAQGDVEATSRWIEEWKRKTDAILQAPEERDERIHAHLRKYVHIVMARLSLALGQPGEALALLDRLLPLVKQAGRRDTTIEIEILKALAFQAQGDVARAMAALEHALSLAEPGGYVRVFVDEGEPMADLLRAAASRGLRPEYTHKLLSAFAPTLPHPHAQPLIEPLSDRELEVLQLIAEGLSNREIAQRLFLALPTVKWHSGNIYGKLGVKNRTQAATRARELGILPAA